MTRRIALAILLTCWLVLLTGGSMSYFVIRHALLEELDASLVLRASSLPELLGLAEGTKKRLIPAGDRYIIRNSRGQTLARPGRRVATTRPVDLRARQFTTLADGRRMRSVTVAFPDGDGAGDGSTTVMYSGSAERYDRLIGRLGFIFASIGMAAGLLTAGVVLAVVRSALRPVTALANTITSINEATLDRRLDVDSLPEELRPMAGRLNQMLNRLATGLLERKQFMADAAHELRTPVAALLTTMEVALRRPRDSAALTQVLRECVADVRTMRRLVEALLEQFRTAAATPSVGTPPEVDVSGVLDFCLDSAASAARQKGVQIRRLYPGDIRYRVHAQRLRSIVGNLVDNAVEYNTAGGKVEVSCETSDDGLNLVVSDTGPGIAGDLLPHVFQPFFRGHDESATEGGHCGLGLYLVKSHVDALGGTCAVRNITGSGTEFRVRIPGAGYNLSDALREPEAAALASK